MRNHFLARWLFILLPSLLLTSCQFVEKFNDVKHSLFKRGNQNHASSPRPSPEFSPSSSNPRLSQAHAELLAEMHQVVFLRPIQNRSVFGSYVDSLNQGATLEGIYNGLVHSAIYRDLEMSNAQKSDPRFLNQFVEELKSLLTLRKNKIKLGSYHLLPLPKFDPSQEFIEQKYHNQKTWSWDPSLKLGSIQKEELVQFFSRTGPFILKRVIGDEAQKLIFELKSDPNQLLNWYADWAASKCKVGIDFGLEQRNRCDESFHRQWASQVPIDRLIWEVLNRLQRILNQTLIISGGVNGK